MYARFSKHSCFRGRLFHWALIVLCFGACSLGWSAATHTIVDGVDATTLQDLANRVAAAQVALNEQSAQRADIAAMASGMGVVNVSVQSMGAGVYNAVTGTGFQAHQDSLATRDVINAARADTAYGNYLLGGVNSGVQGLNRALAPIVSGGETNTLPSMTFNFLSKFDAVFGTSPFNTNSNGDPVPPVATSGTVPNLLWGIYTNSADMAGVFRTGAVIQVNATNITFGSNFSAEVAAGITNALPAFLGGQQLTVGVLSNVVREVTIGGQTTTNELGRVNRSVISVLDELVRLRQDANTNAVFLSAQLADLIDTNRAGVLQVTNSVWESMRLATNAAADGMARLGTNVSQSYYTNSQALLLGVTNGTATVTNALGRIERSLGGLERSTVTGAAAEADAAGMGPSAIGSVVSGFTNASGAGAMAGSFGDSTVLLGSWRDGATVTSFFVAEDWLVSQPFGGGPTNKLDFWPGHSVSFSAIVAAVRWVILFSISAGLLKWVLSWAPENVHEIQRVAQIKSFSVKIAGTETGTGIGTAGIYLVANSGFVLAVVGFSAFAIFSALATFDPDVTLAIVNVMGGAQDRLARMAGSLLGFLFPIQSAWRMVSSAILLWLTGKTALFAVKQIQGSLVAQS